MNRNLLIIPAATITKCDKCTGANKGKSLVGMDILWDLKKTGKVWEGGEILDPKKGKVYDCKIELDGTDKLKVRGFVGVSMFGGTQTNTNPLNSIIKYCFIF